MATPVPGVGQYASATFDTVVKSDVHYISRVVPVIYKDDTGARVVPADLYYCLYGVANSQSALPLWQGGAATNTTLQNWDATDGRQYITFGNGGGTGTIGGAGPLFIYPTGIAGAATAFSPKNPDAVQVVLSFRARFNGAADYGFFGIGAVQITSGSGFSPATGHVLQVHRNNTQWGLYTMDGATETRSSGGSADGNWHDFQAVWVLGATPTITLYVDNVATITKTTNLPSRPLQFYATANNVNTIDLIDVSVYWEGA